MASNGEGFELSCFPGNFAQRMVTKALPTQIKEGKRFTTPSVKKYTEKTIHLSLACMIYGSSVV